MKSSLSDYTLEEIKNMGKPLGNKNYDLYDVIMNHVCYEFDDIIMHDDELRGNIDEFVQLRNLNFFIMSFVSNKKMKLTEIEQEKLKKLISNVDKAAYRNQDNKSYNTYEKQFRKCMSEFLERSAHFKLEEPLHKIFSKDKR